MFFFETVPGSEDGRWGSDCWQCCFSVAFVFAFAFTCCFPVLASNTELYTPGGGFRHPNAGPLSFKMGISCFSAFRISVIRTVSTKTAGVRISKNRSHTK